MLNESHKNADSNTGSAAGSTRGPKRGPKRGLKPDTLPDYAELHCVSNFSFLRGASRPEELVDTAIEKGYTALAITDECSLAGVVRAHGRIREHRAEGHKDLHLIIGSEFALDDGFRLVVLARDGRSYSRLCQLITTCRRAADKGSYAVDTDVIEQAGLEGCCVLLVPPALPSERANLESWFCWVKSLSASSGIALELHFGLYDKRHLHWLADVGSRHELPLVAAGDVHMHARRRRALQDALACIRHGVSLDKAGRALFANGERHLRDRRTLASLYPPEALDNAVAFASLCTFDLDELDYRYPREVVPDGMSPPQHLSNLTYEGARRRWPDGLSSKIKRQIEHELQLIADMQYESYFLTVHDIVNFARGRGILCQGRGSAANSVVCFCLGITEVDPDKTRLLFERFISKERNEPPDIDIDFEHERREEVIQYLYQRYGRHRAALAATVITYRKRSAVRDLGKTLGLAAEQIDVLSRSLAWWDGVDIIGEKLAEMGFDTESPLMTRFLYLLGEILGFPRHLSQHVGGFVISDRDLSTLVPVENASMADRTIIQWDKNDLEELGLMKVDVLALGMLTAISKCFAAIKGYRGITHTMATLPQDDKATYDMICKADTVGVFQIESRAQMSMLPRLKPRCYYDLVIEVSIVRPGPIQGGMVNPYLKRRQGIEPVVYPNNALKSVLERTLGVPVFQEQVMEIAMVAAGFTAGQADQLRRSMAAWRRSGQISTFHDKVVGGMINNGYELEFAERIFKQIEGFGEYGFPESHAASFALLVYVSCWLKCHEPAAFLCAMLNSQPLGFYDVSELLQDARRHEVEVLAVDINASDSDHALVPPAACRERGISSAAAVPHELLKDSKRHQPAVQLGLRLIGGLSRDSITRILAARAKGPFTSADDLVRRAALDTKDAQALASSGALVSIAGDRHRAQWELLGVERLPELLQDAVREPAADTAFELPTPTEGEDIVADYRSLGLTLGRHPLALLRPRLKALSLMDSLSWAEVPDRHPASLAGIVKLRQRPGSAKGVMFMTLEDEGGPMNVIIWTSVLERHRKQIIGTQLVAVHGVTQREQGIAHIVAERFEDLSWMLGSLTASVRNFH